MPRPASRLYAVSRRLALLLSQHDAAKQELKEANPTPPPPCGRLATDNGDKITETAIASELPLVPEVQQSATRLRELKKQIGPIRSTEGGVCLARLRHP